MERIGIYGGTYNPPHVGHACAAEYALKALGLDRLFMIPTNISPHKQIDADAPTPGQRLQMTVLATADIPGISVSDIELCREGPSYTYQTVEQLASLYPDAELTLLMGTDMFLSFAQWREPERIMAKARLAVFYRGEKGEEEAIAQQKLQLEAMGARVELVKNPVVDISSTQLRRMLKLGCASEFLHPRVLEYIQTSGLYGTADELHGLSMEQLEAAVTKLLKPNRVAHVLGCRQTALELARRWGADETDAQRSALLHDITKALDGPLQLTLARSYGMILDDFSSRNPKTLHALTGSWVAKRIFGENEAVVSAIASHTTGKPGMNMLETLLYVADYIEPNRDFPGVERLRELAFTDIWQALELGLTMTIDLLKQQGREVSPESAQTLAWIKERKIQ